MSTLRTFNLQNPDSGTVNIEMDQGGNTLMTGIATVRGAAHFTSTSGSDAVGIGTDITAYKLDVRVTGAEAGLRVYNPDTSSNASGILRLGNDDNQNAAFLRLNGANNTSAVGGAGSLVLGHGLSKDLHLSTAGVSRFKITSSGVKQVLNGNLNIYQTYIDFSGDQSSTPNTAVALYRPADGTFAISTQNTERFRIRSDGRIAIGTQTINTDSMLSIHRSSSDQSQIRFTNTTTGEGGNNGLIVGIDNNEHGRIFNMENNPLRFGTNNTERLRIDPNGRILVGPGAVATPKCGYAGIDIPNNDWSIIMGGSDGNGNRGNNLNKDGRFAGAHYTNAEEPVGIIRCTSGSSANELHMGGGTSLVNAATQLSFYTAANTTTTGGTERLRITSDGDLLLGTTSNAGGNRLYVVDSFTDSFVNPSDSILRVQNADSSGTTTQASISFTSQTTGSNADSAIVSQAEDASGNASLQFWTDTSNGMSEKLRITSDGKVGINESNPRAKLDVRGTALIADDIGSTLPSTFPASDVQLMVYTSTNGQPITNTNCARLLLMTDAKETGAQGYNGAIDFGNSDCTASGANNQYSYRLASIMSEASTDTSSGNVGDGNLQFWTKTQTGSLTERVRIRTSGNMVSNHAVYGKYQICQIRRGSDVATGNQTPSTSMSEIHTGFRTSMELYSNNPFIRMNWVCNGELDGTMPRAAMRFYYQVNNSGAWYALGRPLFFGSPQDQNIEQACASVVMHMEAITLNAGNTITVTPYWASEQSGTANINFGQTWTAFGGVPMASYLILEEIASDDGGI